MHRSTRTGRSLLESPTYVCQQCLSRRAIHIESRQGGVTQQSRLPKRQHVLPPAQHILKRSFRNTADQRAAADAVLQSQPEYDLPPNFPIRKTNKSEYESTPLGKSRSAIREQLRAWSAQKKRADEENKPDKIAATGRIGVLPNSLFIDDNQPAQEDEEGQHEVDEFDESLEGENKLRLVPGDFLHVPLRCTRNQFAIFLGMAGMQHQFLLASGKWAVEAAQITDSTLVLHNFATPEEIEAIRKYLPRQAIQREDEQIGVMTTVAAMGEIPLDFTRPFMQRMSDLKEEMSAFRRDHIQAIDNIYENIADEGHYNNLTLTELVRKLFNTEFDRLTQGAKMAIFMNLQKNIGKTLAVSNRKSDVIRIIATPKRLHQQFQLVIEWARQYQESAAQAALGKDVSTSLKRNPLSAFIDKARRLILVSRKIRSPTTIGSLGPSSNQHIKQNMVEMKDTGEVYSENDKMILEFLWNTYLRKPLDPGRTTYHSIGSLILRAIGAYPKLRLENRIGRLLLQELGSLAPWAEKSDESVVFPLPGRRGAHVADQLLDETERLANELGFGTGDDTKIPLADTMADIRQDWSSMEVLCIDKPSTHVIDDGYSLEEAKDAPGCYWIHVHVAHPTAYIGTDHPFAQRARIFGASLYTSRQTYPVTPWSVARTLSLTRNEAALTVSTLINEDGEVKQVKMAPTLLKNCVRLNRYAVDKLMGQEPAEQAYLIVGADTRLNTKVEIPEEDLQTASKYMRTLRKIDDLVRSRVKARQREVPEYANFPHSTLNGDARVSFLEPYDSGRLLRSYHYHGDPTIKCVADRFEWKGRHGDRHMNDDLTAHVMMLAAESAAQWLKERNIPAAFTGALTHPEFPLSKLNSLDGNERFLSPMQKVSSHPIPHVMLNVMHYIRITSPLRRYTDMLAHWQIDAYLRAEASGQIQPGQSIDDANSLAILPFSRAAVDDYIANYFDVITQIERMMRQSTVHWTMQAFFRAFHFKEAELPPVWDMRVENTLGPANNVDPNDSRIRGRIMPFNLRAHLMKSDEGWETQAKWQQFLPVKIELVDVETPSIFVKAVGPPSDTCTQLDPIRATPKGKTVELGESVVAEDMRGRATLRP